MRELTVARPPAGGPSLGAARADRPAAIPFGLLELDAAGTVIRYSPAAELLDVPLARDILGRNFFTEIAPAETGALRARFRAFMSGRAAVERFTLGFETGRQRVRAQVLLARVSEHSAAGHRQLALVRITPDQPAAARP